MILVLSGNGREAKGFSELLEKEGLEHLCVLPALQDAAAFGCGNVIVGRFDSDEMKKLLIEENACGVADVDAGGVAMSRAAMEACKILNIPYIKYLPLPNTARELVTGMVGSYQEIAEGIDCLTGTVLLYTTPEAAMAIAKRVKKPEKIYAPILRGSSFDVDTALAYGLPLLNILEVDNPDGVEVVIDLMEKVGAKLLVCDGSWELSDKLKAAETKGIPLVLTHKTGIEYTGTAWNSEALLRALRSWMK